MTLRTNVGGVLGRSRAMHASLPASLPTGSSGHRRVAVAQAILLQDVDALGERGSVIDVSPGYLRNYLVPRKLAQPATPASIAESQRRIEAAERAADGGGREGGGDGFAAAQDRPDDLPPSR